MQAAALEVTLQACNEAATWAASVAFEKDARRPLQLRKHTYAEIRGRWGLGAQAAQHAIKKTCDAYTTLKANLRAGRYGRPGTKRHTRASGKPVTFRPQAAQPYDDRMLSWQHEQRTVSIWTTAGRMKGVAFTGQAEQLAVLAAHRRGESDLLCRGGKWFLIATCEIPEKDLNAHPDRVPRGGSGDREHRRDLRRRASLRPADQPQAGAATAKLRSKLQKKDTKSAKRRAKKYAGQRSPSQQGHQPQDLETDRGGG